MNVINLNTHPLFYKKHINRVKELYSKAYYLDKEDQISDEAEDLYRKVIAINPEFSDAMINLGNICYKKGNILEAIALYDEAIRINDNLYEAHYNLGVLLYKELNEIERPLELFHKTISINSKFADAYFYLGVIYQGKKKFEDAASCYKQYISLSEDSHFTNVAEQNITQMLDK